VRAAERDQHFTTGAPLAAGCSSQLVCLARLHADLLVYDAVPVVSHEKEPQLSSHSAPCAAGLSVPEVDSCLTTGEQQCKATAHGFHHTHSLLSNVTTGRCEYMPMRR
jgi:hypothetical protein